MKCSIAWKYYLRLERPIFSSADDNILEGKKLIVSSLFNSVFSTIWKLCTHVFWRRGLWPNSVQLREMRLEILKTINRKQNMCNRYSAWYSNQSPL